MSQDATISYSHVLFILSIYTLILLLFILINIILVVTYVNKNAKFEGASAKFIMYNASRITNNYIMNLLIIWK